jgi:hypothetical protein
MPYVYQLTMVVLLYSRQYSDVTNVLINFLCQALKEGEMIAERHSVFMAKRGRLVKKYLNFVTNLKAFKIGIDFFSNFLRL